MSSSISNLASRFKSLLRARTPLIFKWSKYFYVKWRRWTGTRRVKGLIKENRTRRIILGAANQRDEGWLPTDIYELDITAELDWARFFQPGSVDSMLAEHVWEHLTKEQGRLAALNCYKYLKPEGHLRVAVPDGFNPDPNYIEGVRVGGTGPGAQDHKVIYNCKTIKHLFEEAGFYVYLLEYFDENGVFRTASWSLADGTIHRSSLHHPELPPGGINSSLILDARKRREPDD